MPGRRKRPAKALTRTSSPSSEASSTTPEPVAQLTQLAKFNVKYSVGERSNVDILAAQMKKWKSKAYQHYVMPPTIIVEDGEVKYQFFCKKKPSISVMRVRHDVATSNLVRHIDECDPIVPETQSLIFDFAQGSTYDKAKFRFIFALWVVRRHRPYSVAEDPELKQLFEMLYGKVDIPSRWTVSRDVLEIFETSKGTVSAYLKGHAGYLHIGLDGWTSPNVFSILGVTVHIYTGGKLISFVLDFVKLTKRHTGVYLAEKMAECLEEYGIQKKVLSVVADNAENNNTLVSELETLLPDAPFTAQHRVRCMGHILNLVVKGILSQFTRKKNSSDDDTDDEDGFDDDDTNEETDDDTEGDEVMDEDRERADQAFIEDIAEEVETSIPLSSDDVNLGCHAMTKILGLAKRVFHTSLLRDELEKQCTKLRITSKVLMRAVPTRWNTVATSLDRAIYLQAPIDKLVILEQFNTSRGMKLKKYKLSKDEWDLLGQLSPILSYFLEATVRMSHASLPLLHEVIPLIDALTDMLDKAAANENLFPAVRVAVKKGRKVLDKYYSKTDESVMYRCAMLLHPRYKTSYFIKHGWPADWVQTAVDLLRAEWEKNYKPRLRSDNEFVASPGTGSNDAMHDLFNAIDNWGLQAGSDPLDDWLASPPIVSVRDPLAWWGALLNDGNVLAAMAIDILSTPATSTEVERAFSQGGLTVSKHRHSLSAPSTRAATVLCSWAKIPGLIPEHTIIENFREKSSRPKNGSSEDINSTTPSSPQPMVVD